MVTKVNSVMFLGVEVKPVEVQVDLSPGLFDFSIVGMASKEILESKRRIISAIKNSGFIMPMHRITVNLAPADISKTTTGLDFPIAVGILQASGQVHLELKDKIFWGELALDGKLESTKGVMAIALSPLADKEHDLLIPVINASQAVISEARKVLVINSLRDILASDAEIVGRSSAGIGSMITRTIPDISLIDNPKLIRAIMLTVVGKHNILAIGPAGVGKSYLLKLIEHLTSPLNKKDYLAVNEIYSIAGLNFKEFVDYPPFRTPHNSITQAAFIGGGSRFRVGEITLAHKGFLMLDEINLFNSRILDLLRQPLEEKTITLQRGNYNYKLPCDFTLLSTMNPCPCGNYGSNEKECKCSNSEKQKYWKKLNKPTLDRIDMQVFVSNELLNPKNKKINTISLKTVKEKIEIAQEFRANRKEDREVPKTIQNLLLQAVKSYEMSIRGMKKVLSLANTIADLNCDKKLTEFHISEALNYRRIDYEGSTGG